MRSAEAALRACSRVQPASWRQVLGGAPGKGQTRCRGPREAYHPPGGITRQFVSDILRCRAALRDFTPPDGGMGARSVGFSRESALQASQNTTLTC